MNPHVQGDVCLPYITKIPFVSIIFRNKNIPEYSGTCERKAYVVGVIAKIRCAMSVVVIDMAYGKGHLRGDCMHLVGIPWKNNYEADEAIREEISRSVPLSQV